LAEGVVGVDGECREGHLGRDGRDHGSRRAGRAGADGVAERDLEAAHAVQLGSDPRHGGRRDAALVGAAEDAGDVAADADVPLARRVDDGAEAVEALGDRAVDVASGEGLEAAPKTAISVAPAARRSRPFRFGTRTG
jgi:hypothetical protein